MPVKLFIHEKKKGDCVCHLMSSSIPVSTYVVPGGTTRWPNAGPMLNKRRRRWANNGPALGQSLVFTSSCRPFPVTGVAPDKHKLAYNYIIPKLGWRRWHWPNVKQHKVSFSRWFYYSACIINCNQPEVLCRAKPKGSNYWANQEAFWLCDGSIIIW